jgi:DNA mismatch repair protein MutS
MKKMVIALLLCVVSINAISGDVAPKKMYESIADSLVRSLQNVDEGEKNRFGEHKVLPAVQAYPLVGHLFDETCSYAESSILNKNGLSDLELFVGSADEKASVFNTFNQTKTIPGALYLAGLIANPTANIETLHNRQHTIVIYRGASKAHTGLSKGLSAIKKGQGHLITQINNVYLTEKMPEWVKNSFVMRTVKKLQNFYKKSPLLTQTISTVGTFFSARMAYVMLVTPTYVGVNNLVDMAIGTKPATFADVKNNLKVPLVFATCGYVYYKYKSMSKSMKKDQFDALVGTAKVVRGLKLLSVTLKKNPELGVSLEHVQALHDLFDSASSTYSKDMHQLVELLLTDTFTGDISFFRYEGRILAATILLSNVAKEFGSALYAAGEIDAYCSCAQVMELHKDLAIKYSFAQYVEGADTPLITVQALWNPLVALHKNVQNTVLNDIDLGSLGNNNVIITGPNAGGKSTFLKALTLNVLYAQTVGIVPAELLVLTPFSKINTYMNITDDTAKGKSLFVSEVERAQALLKTIKELDNKEFSFSIMDEMFTGTAAREGEAASYAIARNLGTFNNSIMLLATHFPKLQALEHESSAFKNYQVRVVYNEDGSFSYPYKLEVGAANQNIAFDILAEKGFEGSIIDDARKLMHA